MRYRALPVISNAFQNRPARYFQLFQLFNNVPYVHNVPYVPGSTRGRYTHGGCVAGCGSNKTDIESVAAFSDWCRQVRR